ncbi:MAG: Fic family protein [Acidimicrobiales bacterium]
MSTVIRRRWINDHAGPSRKDNRGCEYEAYVPDLLVSRAFAVEGDVAADIAEAEAAITRLNVEATSLVDTESLARILLRAESVASSRIEGLEIGARRLLRAEAARDLGDDPGDVTAVEVLGNIDAMAHAIEQIGPGDPISTDLILGVHQRLLAGTRLAEHGGRLREQQNWIGGSAYNPCSATFVPPPPEHVPALVDDLLAFASDDSLPTVAQAAIAHAQFETIHPFVDGNGRTGRALIHLILRRRGLAPRVLPPVSLILATWSQDYIEALTAYRFRGRATSKQASDGVNLWVGRFATACTRAVEDASSFERRAEAIETEWRERLGRVRARSSADLLLRLLVGAPVISVKSAANLIGRSFVHTNEAVARLVEAGILKQVTLGRRNRAFEAPDIIAAFTDLERQLASPEGDTRTSDPVRRVPRRR